MHGAVADFERRDPCGAGARVEVGVHGSVEGNGDRGGVVDSGDGQAWGEWVPCCVGNFAVVAGCGGADAEGAETGTCVAVGLVFILKLGGCGQTDWVL